MNKRGGPQVSPSSWTRGDRKTRCELERLLGSDKDDHVTRFALVRLLASKGECDAAEELLRGPGVENNILADPTTHVALLSSLGAAYLTLWRARGQQHPDREGMDTRASACRPDVSAERVELLHQAQRFLEEALTAPENVNDPVIRAQVAFCKEAMGHCKEALTIYAAIIADSPLSPGTSTVIFRTSVLLAHVGRFDECVKYLEFLEGRPPKGCSRLLLEAVLYTCYMAMGLEMKISRRLKAFRDAFNDEYAAGRIAREFTREEIPWDRLPGWFHTWREIGEQCLRSCDYVLGVQMLTQALLIKEDAETLVCNGETLWVVGDAKRALQHCERAYAADPWHAGAKGRLTGWAPDTWKERIAKEEDRRNAVAEIQRQAEVAGKKADAMVARRARREKIRVLSVWRRLHTKQTLWRAARAEAKMNDKRINGDRKSSSAASSSPRSASGSRSASSSSSSSSSCSTLSSLSPTALDKFDGRSVPTRSAVPVPPPFPTPSMAEAARAGRAHFTACLISETEEFRRQRGGVASGGVTMAPVEGAAKMIQEAMIGGVGNAGFRTPEMLALARFGSQRRAHEAKNTQALFGE